MLHECIGNMPLCFFCENVTHNSKYDPIFSVRFTRMQDFWPSSQPEVCSAPSTSTAARSCQNSALWASRGPRLPPPTSGASTSEAWPSRTSPSDGWRRCEQSVSIIHNLFACNSTSPLSFIYEPISADEIGTYLRVRDRHN